MLLKQVRKNLGPGYDVEKDFTPGYNPWEQRMCLVPDADLFEAICEGRASIVTDQVETFTERGLRLASGGELEADVIVTATGLNLLALGGLEIRVDGHELDLSSAMIYRGCMLSGVPNFAFAFGYTNASWTLKCDLTSQYVCRLLAHMEKHGYAAATPQNRDPSLTAQPFVDFSSGYVLRSIDKFPKQGSKRPWRLYQNYALDLVAVKRAPLEDGAMMFSPHTVSRSAAALAAAA